MARPRLVRREPCVGLPPASAGPGPGIGRPVEEILDSLVEGVAVFSDDLRLAYVNKNARFMLQVDARVYQGLSLAEAFPPEIAAALSRALERAEQGEIVLTDELTSRFPEGTEIVLGISVSPLPPSPDSPGGYVLICRDLSVSREVLRLREIAQAKEEFFSTISHELRTPLTSIIAYAEGLLGGLAVTEEEKREFLTIIHSEGERLSRLIDEVLDLSRMEANRITLHSQDLDLRDVIQASVQGIRGAAAKAGLQLESELTPDPVMVTADPERLRQVLTNLLGNAIKFTPRGGHITTGCVRRERHAEAWVTDTGVGIAPEDLSRIFEKFERIEGQGETVKGTGLGLAIAQGLVERMGGRIWVESTLGEGSAFRFTVPRARAAGGSPSAAA